MHKQQMTSLKTHSEARPLGPGPINSAKLGPSVKVLSALQLILARTAGTFASARVQSAL